MRLATITLASLILIFPACGSKTPVEPPGAAAPDAPEVEPAPAAASAPTLKTSHAERWAYDVSDTRKTIRTLIARADGSLVVLGQVREPGSRKLLLAAIDKDGKLLWEKVHGDVLKLATLHNGGGAALSDGGFLVVGSRIDGDLNYQVWAGRFSAEGDLVWEANLGEREDWAVARWGIALGADHALVSVSRGDSMDEKRSFVRISLADGATVETSAAPGHSEPPERGMDGTWTTRLTLAGEGGSTLLPFAIDGETGVVTALTDTGPAAWEKPGSGMFVLRSTPLVGGGRVLVTRIAGDSARVTLATTDMAGGTLWKGRIEDDEVREVPVLCATHDGGFAYVAERFTPGAMGLEELAGTRIVRMD